VLFIETDASSASSGPATGVLQLQQFPRQFAIPIFDAFSPLPPAAVATGAQSMLSALVANDSTNAGVDWTLTYASTSCGSLSAAHTASGAPTTFTAPSAIPTGNTVTITASAHADSTKTVTATVTIGTAVSIAFTMGQVPPMSLETNDTATISATVANDPLNRGVDWTVTCGSADCGSYSPTHTASGATTTYTAPASVPTSGSVTITATATATEGVPGVPPATATATVTITTPPPCIGPSTSECGTFTQAPPTAMQEGTTAEIIANVQNDSMDLGVNWTATCGSTDCVNPTHTTNAAPQTNYTAPASVPASGSVIITATTVATPAATLTQPVTISSVGVETVF
jgi:hypothetical protein